MKAAFKETNSIMGESGVRKTGELFCSICNLNLDGKNYCFRDGSFYCELHYQTLFLRGVALFRSPGSSSFSSQDSLSKELLEANHKTSQVFSFHKLTENVGVDTNESSSSDEDAEYPDEGVLPKNVANSVDKQLGLEEETTGPISISVPLLPNELEQQSSASSGPPCAQCRSAVDVGVCIVDRYYHAECFRCTACKRRIKLPKYAIAEGNLYCVKHFKKLLAQWKPSEEKFSQKPDSLPELPNPMSSSSPHLQREQTRLINAVHCASCGMQLHESIYRNGRHYHPDCVDCEVCDRTAGTGRFTVRGGKIYCSEHAEKKYQQKAAKQQEEPVKVHKRTNSHRRPGPRRLDRGLECFICRQPIEGGLVVDGKNYHPWCFRCSRCHKKLRLKGYQLLDGVPVCLRRTCKVEVGLDNDPADNPVGKVNNAQQSSFRHNLLQHVTLTSPCTVCNFPAQEGYCVFGKVYHPGCFKCSDCRMELTLKKCRIVQDAFYCPKDCRKITSTAKASRRASSPEVSRNHHKRQCWLD
ncbi:hypothetical protein CRM22_008789 [Opisthorchis felineus]|uniref:LIM zinc-binding domain-containing protein n=1 Tax=Opisthorchis felineus TaxID=147828 RepID=A0A4S2LAE6_OPIFE|nr:hypothetical protein CRM22_008789 [Opisthorchis felineus]